MRRLFGSFVSAAAGWTAGLAVFLVILATQWISSPSAQNASEAFTALLGVGFFMGVYVLVVWVLALAPLYFLVPAGSVLWRPGVCTFCGALAGLAIALAIFFMARDPLAL